MGPTKAVGKQQAPLSCRESGKTDPQRIPSYRALADYVKQHYIKTAGA